MPRYLWFFVKIFEFDYGVWYEEPFQDIAFGGKSHLLSALIIAQMSYTMNLKLWICAGQSSSIMRFQSVVPRMDPCEHHLKTIFRGEELFDLMRILLSER